MTNSDTTYGTWNKTSQLLTQHDMTGSNSTLSADGSTWLGDGSTLRAVTPSSITLNNPIRVVVASEHGIVDSSKVAFADVAGTTELNGNTYYAKRINATTIDLYSDRALSTTVDGGGSFTAYADDDSGSITFVLAKTVFANTGEAQEFFYTDDALAVFNECCTELQWALVDDDDSLATGVKYTYTFGSKGPDKQGGADDWPALFTSRKQALEDAGNWHKNPHYQTLDNDVSSHLF